MLKMTGIASLLLTMILISGFKPAEEISEEKIDWLSFEEAVEKAEEDPRPLVIDVYTSWCGWCKKMDASTFEDPEVVKMVNEKFYAVKLDGEYKGDIVFKGHTFKFVNSGRRGYHELPASLMNGRMSYPTIVYMNKDLELLQAIPGFKSAQQIHPILEFFGNEYEKTTSWQDFMAENYESPYKKEE